MIIEYVINIIKACSDSIFSIFLDLKRDFRKNQRVEIPTLGKLNVFHTFFRLFMRSVFHNLVLFCILTISEKNY